MAEHRDWYKWGTLPHFDGPGTTQFVTFCLAQAWADVAQEGSARVPRTAGDRRRIEDELDQGFGACELGIPEVADLVQGGLLHFDGSRYDLRA